MNSRRVDIVVTLKTRNEEREIGYVIVASGKWEPLTATGVGRIPITNTSKGSEPIWVAVNVASLIGLTR
jgi:hypothetical protein